MPKFSLCTRDIASAIKELLDAVNEVFKHCQAVGKMVQYKKVRSWSFFLCQYISQFVFSTDFCAKYHPRLSNSWNQELMVYAEKKLNINL